MQTCVYTHICINIHTHIYIYIYIYARVCIGNIVVFAFIAWYYVHVLVWRCLWPMVACIPSAFNQLAASRCSPTSQPGQHLTGKHGLPEKPPFQFDDFPLAVPILSHLHRRFPSLTCLTEGCWFQVRLWISVAPCPRSEASQDPSPSFAWCGLVADVLLCCGHMGYWQNMAKLRILS